MLGAKPTIVADAVNQMCGYRRARDVEPHQRVRSASPLSLRSCLYHPEDDESKQKEELGKRTSGERQSAWETNGPP